MESRIGFVGLGLMGSAMVCEMIDFFKKHYSSDRM